MTPSEVEVDGELAERASKIAAAHGETVEDVVARLLQEYVNDDEAAGA